jgi:hypothetical protein
MRGLVSVAKMEGTIGVHQIDGPYFDTAGMIGGILL